MEVFLWFLHWCDGGANIKLNVGCGDDVKYPLYDKLHNVRNEICLDIYLIN